MPRWDFRCNACQTTEELIFRSSEDADAATCKSCGGKLERLPSAASFTITGYNAKNGYSRS